MVAPVFNTPVEDDPLPWLTEQFREAGAFVTGPDGRPTVKAMSAVLGMTSSIVTALSNNPKRFSVRFCATNGSAATDGKRREVVIGIKPMLDPRLTEGQRAALMVALAFHEVGHVTYSVPITERAVKEFGKEPIGKWRFRILNLVHDLLLETNQSRSFPGYAPTLDVKRGYLGIQWNAKLDTRRNRLASLLQATLYPQGTDWSRSEDLTAFKAWADDWAARARAKGHKVLDGFRLVYEAEAYLNLSIPDGEPDDPDEEPTPEPPEEPEEPDEDGDSDPFDDDEDEGEDEPEDSDDDEESEPADEGSEPQPAEEADEDDPDAEPSRGEADDANDDDWDDEPDPDADSMDDPEDDPDDESESDEEPSEEAEEDGERTDEPDPSALPDLDDDLDDGDDDEDGDAEPEEDESDEDEDPDGEDADDDDSDTGDSEGSGEDPEDDTDTDESDEGDEYDDDDDDWGDEPGASTESESDDEDGDDTEDPFDDEGDDEGSTGKGDINDSEADSDDEAEDLPEHNQRPTAHGEEPDVADATEWQRAIDDFDRVQVTGRDRMVVGSGSFHKREVRILRINRP